MGHDSGDRPPAIATSKRSALSADEVRAFTDRAPRCKVALQVMCTVPGGPAESGIVDAELINVSNSGMLLACKSALLVGTVVDFEFKLDDGLVALAGRAEVVRTVPDPPRMGLRFVMLDSAGASLVQRLLEASEFAPEIPTAPGYAPPAVEFDHGSIRVRLTAATASFFTYNPLLHLGVRGCFLPADSDVPLGTGYQLDVFDDGDRLILRCKAKVAAKQDRWIGLRLLDVDRSALQALRAEVAKLESASK